MKRNIHILRQINEYDRDYQGFKQKRKLSSGGWDEKLDIHMRELLKMKK